MKPTYQISLTELVSSDAKTQLYYCFNNYIYFLKILKMPNISQQTENDEFPVFDFNTIYLFNFKHFDLLISCIKICYH